MLSVEQALAQILEAVPVLNGETVPLLDSLGRTLAEDVLADISQPPFDNSAVDGYAVRSEDVETAGLETPVVLTCIADIPAGAWPEIVVEPGQCARIMTGAPLPRGTDCVVMVEDTAVIGRDNRERIAMRVESKAGGHVRYAGEDTRAGERVLEAGTPIRAAQIGLLAAMGRKQVQTVRLPRVAVISTGDEVVELTEGTLPAPGKIRNSNSYALAALVRESGAELHSRLHIPDDMEATLAALRQCAGLEENEEDGKAEAGADVIVTAGGVSVGDRDFVKPALETLGTLDLWRVAVKPGKPLAFGRIGRTLFFGLPGNPVSAQVTFELFVRPCLLKMAGRPEGEWQRPQVEAELIGTITHAPGRREYARGHTEWRNGRFIAQPLSGQSSANIESLSRANSLLIVPEQSGEMRAGQQISVLLLR